MLLWSQVQANLQLQLELMRLALKSAALLDTDMSRLGNVKGVCFMSSAIEELSVRARGCRKVSASCMNERRKGCQRGKNIVFIVVRELEG